AKSDTPFSEKAEGRGTGLSRLENVTIVNRNGASGWIFPFGQCVHELYDVPAVAMTVLRKGSPVSKTSQSPHGIMWEVQNVGSPGAAPSSICLRIWLRTGPLSIET